MSVENNAGIPATRPAIPEYTCEQRVNVHQRKGKVVSNELKRLFSSEEIVFNGITIHIYELVKDATFNQMFSDLGEKRRCWKDEEEALAFSRAHLGKLGLNANFFELESKRVARMYLDEHGPPYVRYVYPLSNDGTWYASYQRRVFSPQQ